MPNKNRNAFWDVGIALLTLIVIFLESLKIFFLMNDKENFFTNLTLIKICNYLFLNILWLTFWV